MLTAVLTDSSGNQTNHEVKFGDLALVPLGVGETIDARLTPAKGCDLGAGAGGLAAAMEWRVRLLDRLRLEGDRRKVVEATVVLDDVLGPESLADVDRLVEASAARGGVEAGALPSGRLRPT